MFSGDRCYQSQTIPRLLAESYEPIRCRYWDNGREGERDPYQSLRRQLTKTTNVVNSTSDVDVGCIYERDQAEGPLLASRLIGAWLECRLVRRCIVYDDP